MNQPLFRDEALANRQIPWLGTVILAPRLSYRFFVIFAVLVAAAVVALLFFSNYTRKARIDGWLVPQQGLVKVIAPQPGVVTKIHVVEGLEVNEGDPLFVLSAEVQSTALGATQSEIVRQLSARSASLDEERSQIEALTAQRMRSLTDRLAALQLEQAQLDGEIGLQKQRLSLAKKSEARQAELKRRKLIADERMQAAQVDRLEQHSKLRGLERLRISNQRVRLGLENEVKELPITYQGKIGNIERQIAAVEQELAEAEARREIVVPAPESGTVTAIQVERGARPRMDVPLLSIVPKNSLLEAQMFAPSRAIGFLRPSQRVQLRYQAYPYQKFGHYQGTVSAISRSAVNPSELPPQLTGLTSLVRSDEPVYRITVSLASQAVTAYGKPVPLQPGMQLEADVLIEKRRLYEWMLDPLYTLTGKWR